jgi:glucosyl-3-phosphoglycerate phosphatase
MTLSGRTFIARHGETVFNRAKRMQGDRLDSPLTRTGFAQADAMGAALAQWLGTRQALRLYASPAGRALQTMAIITEHIGHDWHETEHDARLQEINVGAWAGRSYAAIEADQGTIVDPARHLFSVRPTGGEWYDDIAARLTLWISDAAAQRGDRLVIMHGISSRVLRGLLLGLPVDPVYGAPIADMLPQGTLAMIGNGTETIVHRGAGTLVA